MILARMGSPGHDTRSVQAGHRRRVLLVVALVSTLLVALPPAEGSAASCPPPGDGSLPALPQASNDPDIITFRGRGWGHGVGMSQFGAQGAAKHGCTAETILNTYYTDAAVQSVSTNTSIRVSLGTNVTKVPVAASHDLPWQRCDGSGCSGVATQPAGETWFVKATKGDGLRLERPDGSMFKIVNARARVRLGESRVARIDADGRNLRYRHGFFEAQWRSNGTAYATLQMPLESYLYGIDEMPFGWEPEALQAQAIAARTYALRRTGIHWPDSPCKCHVVATTGSQVYEGYETEQKTNFARWKNAVDSSRQDVVTYNGGLADTVYASSHGGHSASSAFVWGNAHPYLQPIDDSRWEAASGNPLSAWSAEVHRSSLGKQLGIGTVHSVTVGSPTGPGSPGRIGDPSRGYGGVTFVGSTTGSSSPAGCTTPRDRRTTCSGDAVRSILQGRGHRTSTMFTVRYDYDPGVVPRGASGSWEVDLYRSINRRRAEAGARGLAFDPKVHVDAREWTGHMRTQGQTKESPSLASDAQSACNAEAQGEVVGKTRDPEALLESQLANSSRRRIILGQRWTHLAVSVVRDGDVFWISQRYLDCAGGSDAGDRRPLAESIRASRTVFTGGPAARVVLTRNSSAMETLPAAALAARDGVLLQTTDRTRRTASPHLDPWVRRELDRVLPAGGVVYVVGSAARLPTTIDEELAEAGYRVRRVGRKTGNQTAAAVAREVVRVHGNSRRAYLVSLAVIEEAAAVAGPSVENNQPVLFVGKNGVPAATLEFMEDHNTIARHVIGSPGAVRPSTYAEAGGTARITGGDRFTTSAVMSKRLWGRTSGADGDRFVHLNGSAPVSAQYAATWATYSSRVDSPVVYSTRTRVVDSVANYLDSLGYDSSTTATAVRGRGVSGSLHASLTSHLR